ncbi:MAG: hypothetical protein ACR2HV_10045 [Acidimicrobiales bacterium]
MTPDAGQEPATDAGDPAGAGLLTASWWGTGLFTVTAGTAAVVPALEAVFFVVALVLFVAGCGLFFAAFARGVGRSRTEQVAVPSLFLMAGSTPREVRRSLLGSLAVEVVVALAVSIARPYTILATGALAPMYALGLCGLWSARHGRFPRKPPGRPG